MAPTTHSKGLSQEPVDTDSTASPDSHPQPHAQPTVPTTDPALLTILQHQQGQQEKMMLAITTLLERLIPPPPTAVPPTASPTPPTATTANAHLMSNVAPAPTPGINLTNSHTPPYPPPPQHNNALPPLLPTPGIPAHTHTPIAIPDPPYHRPGKPDYPKFAGSGPSEWLFQIEKYFRYYRVPAEERIAVAAMQLQEEANRWYQGFERERPTHTWEDFKVALLRRFGPTTLEDPHIALKLLKQTGSVRTYQSAFEDLQARIPSCPEPILIGQYIGGLQRRILVQLQVWKPTSLQDAYALARHFESVLDDPTDYPRRRPPWRSSAQPSSSTSTGLTNAPGSFSTDTKPPAAAPRQ